MGTSGDQFGGRAAKLWDDLASVPEWADDESDGRLLRDGSGVDNYGFTKLARSFHDRIEDVGYFDADDSSRGFDKPGSEHADDVSRDFYGGWQFERGYFEGTYLQEVVSDTITCKNVSRAADYSGEGADQDMERKAHTIIDALTEIVTFHRRFFPNHESRLPSPMYRGVDEDARTCTDQRAYAFYKQGYDAMLMMRDLLMNQLGFRNTDTAEDFVKCLRRVRDDLHMIRSTQGGFTQHEWQLAWDYLQLAIQCSVDGGRYAQFGVHCIDTPNLSDDDVAELSGRRYPTTPDFVSDACDYMVEDPARISSLCNYVYKKKLPDLIKGSAGYTQARDDAAREYIAAKLGDKPLRAKRTLRNLIRGEIIEKPTYWDVREAILDGRVRGGDTELDVFMDPVRSATTRYAASVTRDVSNVFAEVLRKVERLQRRPKDAYSTLSASVKAEMARDINNSLKVLAERCGFDISGVKIEDFYDLLVHGIRMTTSQDDAVYDQMLENCAMTVGDDLTNNRMIRSRFMGVPVVMDNMDVLTVESARFDVA